MLYLLFHTLFLFLRVDVCFRHCFNVVGPTYCASILTGSVVGYVSLFFLHFVIGLPQSYLLIVVGAYVIEKYFNSQSLRNNRDSDSQKMDSFCGNTPSYLSVRIV